MKLFQCLLGLSLLAFGMLSAQAIDDLFTPEEIATSLTLPEVDTQPKPVSQAKPELRGDLRTMTGVTRVAFIIDPTGKVTAPRIQSSSDSRLDTPTIEAISQWKFEPALKGGAPVSVRVVLPFRFTGK